MMVLQRTSRLHGRVAERQNGDKDDQLHLKLQKSLPRSLLEPNCSWKQYR